MDRILIKCEAKKKSGALWEIVAFVEGKSANGVYYSGDLIRRVVKRFEGVPSYLYQIGKGMLEHLPEKYVEKVGQLIGNKIGWFRNPRVTKVKGKVALVAELYIHEAAKQVREFFKDLWDQGKTIGFSIVADALTSKKVIDGEEVDYVDDLWFRSADPVTYPAIADAQVIRLLEARKEIEEIIMKDSLVQLLKDIAAKLAPELEVKESLERVDAVTLMGQLTETLDTENFPEKQFKDRLESLSEAIEKEDDKAAEQIAAELLNESEHRNRIATLEKLDELLNEGKLDTATELLAKLTEHQESGGDAESGANRLKEHFGEKAARLLVESIGEEEAIELLPKEESLLWDKLEVLKTLIQDNEVEAAGKLLEAILSGEYAEPYPYPAKEADEKTEASGAEEDEEGEIKAGEVEEKVEDGEASSEGAGEEEGENTAEEGEGEETAEEEDEEEKEGIEVEDDETAGEAKEGDGTGEAGESEVEEEKETGEVEDIEGRISRMELDSLLDDSTLPGVAIERLRQQLRGTKASKSELDKLIHEEEEYLKKLDVTPKSRSVETLQAEFEDRLKTMGEKFAAKETKRQAEFDGQLKTLGEEFTTKISEKLTELEEKDKVRETKELLDILLKAANLTTVSEERVRAAFDGKPATEDAIKAAIASEAKLAAQIVSEMASTVIDFGNDSDPVENEETAEKKIVDFFDLQMNIEEEVEEEVS